MRDPWIGPGANGSPGQAARKVDTRPPTPILLIEDNTQFAALVECILETGSTRFTVHHTETLEAGLEHLGTADVSLVMLDLTLPDSVGRETFDRVRAAAPGVPVIVEAGWMTRRSPSRRCGRAPRITW